ncbi:beta-glucosidase [Gillisia sp. M10.2A]|uniref:Beta-glucosidase n=1 Tax=Gillisia lutea TaxID=2909668 RepID=A0ABS9EBJ3_9FLAO|nr:glucoamylase family protein [Gillisia lutea]MCF4100257.1 beta-glucosidase [Gillisia lutea]
MRNNYLTIFTCVIVLFTGCKNNQQKDKPTDAEDSLAVKIKELSEDALLDTVQKQTLKYFWEYAEPNSGMARERFHPDGNYPKNDAHIVTSGGSGFGLMSLVVGMERKFIPKEEVVARLDKIADFLTSADRYHGAWSHWMNGETGKTQSFSNNDDGGDIVETAFLAQGFIVVREYLKNGNESEKAVAAKYDKLWKSIEWSWYTNNNKDVLFWHWSPTHNWEMNFPLEGYNETLITYVLAAASPSHSISAAPYHKGWARGGDIKSSNTKYDLPLILKHNGAQKFGGPLFWAHYSYLGLNPKGLSDKYANYWDLNVNHSKIDYLYCVANPNKFEGYGENLWGLTASYTKSEDGSIGYTAHSPTNDKGVISPTAAISSIPYTPAESIRAMRYFYNDLHDLTWGPAGFYDAFSLEGEDWVAPRYLAIDQGPQVVMIENYRSGLIWDLFMGAEEIKAGLDKLGFTY